MVGREKTKIVTKKNTMTGREKATTLEAAASYVYIDGKFTTNLPFF